MFDRIRQQRREALEKAMRDRSRHFSPFRCGPILDVSFAPEPDALRATVTITFTDDRRETLLHFYTAHAARLAQLTPDERIDYLRSIWLNYSRTLSAKRNE